MGDTTTIVCAYCGSAKEKYSRHVEPAKADGQVDFFCDKICANNYQARNKEIEVTCSECGSPVKKSGKYVRQRTKNNPSAVFFCGRRCANKYQVTTDCPNAEELQSLYDSGMSLNEIAARFAISRNTIKRKGVVARSPATTRKLRGTDKQSEKTKGLLSKIARDNNFGGTNSRKTFKYKGVTLESSYELTVAQEMDACSIIWTRPKRIPWTDMNGIIHFYTPDFYLPNFDVYLDPKNDFLISKDGDKIRLVQEQNSIRVIVLNKHQLNWGTIEAVISGRHPMIGCDPSKFVMSV